MIRGIDEILIILFSVFFFKMFVAAFPQTPLKTMK